MWKGNISLSHHVRRKTRSFWHWAAALLAAGLVCGAACLQQVTARLPSVAQPAPVIVSQPVASAPKHTTPPPPGQAATRPAVSPTPPRYPVERVAPGSPVGPDFDWTQPTGGPYPELQGDEDLWIDASLSLQRVYVMDGQTPIYTMITSSGGPDTPTPTGTYSIQNRGLWFYNAACQEGAQYWVSWDGWGNYLFHTVAMDADRNVIPSAAAALGSAASHGCFRLTISDARWIYDHIPQGTRVVIQYGPNPAAV